MQTSRGLVRSSADGWGTGLYSADDEHRYWFSTFVDPADRPGDPDQVHHDGLPVVDDHTLVWVGLNPSRSDDNGARRVTLTKVIGWARRHDATRVLGVNLYAWRHTDPARLRRGVAGNDPEHMIGTWTDEILAYLAETAPLVLLAWGADGTHLDRGPQVARLFPRGLVLGLCANGEPLHPARQANSSLLVPRVNPPTTHPLSAAAPARPDGTGRPGWDAMLRNLERDPGPSH